MLSAAQRQAKKAKKANAQKKRTRQAVQRAEVTAVQARESAAYERQDLLLRLGEARLEDAVLLVQDKHEELHGPSELKQFPPDLNPRDSQTVSDDGDSVH
jgi:hypothetical protein